jgi:hypothetical protein
MQKHTIEMVKLAVYGNRVFARPGVYVVPLGPGWPDIELTVVDPVGVYVDKHGTVFTQPTAEAYAMVCKARDHWKANHDHIKLRLAAILTRPDLPREHVKAWQWLCWALDNAAEEAEEYKKQVERLQFTLDQVKRKVTPESEIGQMLSKEYAP